MSDFQKCPRCGGVFMGSACPNCGEGTAIGIPALEGFKVGETFHGLEILEQIGRGGMGVVYKARQPGLDRVVALKLLLPDKSARGDFEARFGREAKALAALSHANIVTVFEFGTDPAGFYFTMEFVDGANLRENLKSRKLATDEAVRIALQVCEGLEYAHAEGIVHRDIKPENILIDRKGRVKIADFGLAKLVGSTAETLLLTQSGAMVGTAAYMSPEQMENAREVDQRTDIYSTGIVLYEMLTGERPLGRFDPPSKHAPVPAGLDEAVMKALSKNPRDRYANVGEFRQALLPHASTVVSQRAGKKRRNLIPWIVLADVLVAIVVLAAWRPWKKPLPPSPLESPSTPVKSDPPPFTIAYEEVRSVKPPHSILGSVAFTPDGKILATSGVGSTLSLWEVETGNLLATLDARAVAVPSIAISPDGKTLAAVALTFPPSISLQFWDLATRAQTRVFAAELVGAALAFSPDGKTIASAGEDGVVRIWDVAMDQEPKRCASHVGTVWSVAFSADGRLLASVGDDEVVHIWDLHDQREMRILKGHVGTIYAVTFLPDGQRVVSAGADHLIRVWHSDSGAELFKLDGHLLRIGSLSVRADGRVLASAGDEKKILLWDLAQRKVACELAGHPERIACVRFAIDGRLLASGGNGHVVKVWGPRK
ncbi:MAG: protein kinase [Planctomycetes bacterium]|nr:protein kinase [Planctomycetota bacterium]